MPAHCPLFDAPIIAICPGDNGILPAQFQRHVRIFDPHEEIFTEGDPVHGVHCLHQGRISLLKRGPAGENHCVGMMSAGNMVGAPELLSDISHNNTGITIERCSACFIPKDIFLLAVRKNPKIMIRVIQQLCMRINGLEQ